MRALPLALLVLLAMAPFGDSARADEDAREVAGPFPWTRDQDTVFLRRVVSAATGLPIAGASARLFAEVLHPLPDFGTPLAVGTSGADGWIRIRKADFEGGQDAYVEPDWAYVEAPGFGVEGIYKPIHESEDFALRPAAEMRVTLLDSLSRPVVGALVGTHVRVLEQDVQNVVARSTARARGTHGDQLCPHRAGLPGVPVEAHLSTHFPSISAIIG